MISATHQDLEALVQQGKFRQDLYFRIHVMDLTLLLLRERGAGYSVIGDISFRRFASDAGIPNKKLTERSKEFLLGQYYPGNVRELRNILRNARLP